MPTCDDITLDRLVDGELSAGERRALLLSLDARQDGWRKCALAFLEAQTWQGELRKLVRPDSHAEHRPRYPRPNRRIVAAGLAMAAGLIVAFILGLALPDRLKPLKFVVPDPSAPFATGASELAVARPHRKREWPVSSSGNDALTLWVRDLQGRPQAMQVPLVDAAALDRRLGVRFRSGVSEPFRRQLEKLGYDVRTKRRYASFWLEHGQPLVVPVEDTHIVPVSRLVY